MTTILSFSIAAASLLLLLLLTIPDFCNGSHDHYGPWPPNVTYIDESWPPGGLFYAVRESMTPALSNAIDSIPEPFVHSFTCSRLLDMSWEMVVVVGMLNYANITGTKARERCHFIGNGMRVVYGPPEPDDAVNGIHRRGSRGDNARFGINYPQGKD